MFATVKHSKMELKVFKAKNGNIAEYISSAQLSGMSDFLDLIGNANYQEVYKIVIQQKHLPEGFLDLKTKVAGDIFQKFSTYNQKLAIVGDFSNIQSKSLNDFICESNRVGRIIFVSSLGEAIDKLDN